MELAFFARRIAEVGLGLRDPVKIDFKDLTALDLCRLLYFEVYAARMNHGKKSSPTIAIDSQSILNTDQPIITNSIRNPVYGTDAR